MKPMVDEDLRFLLHSASLVLEEVDPEFDYEFSRVEFLKRAGKKRPPLEWTEALTKAYAKANAWLDTGNYNARYVVRHTETVAQLRTRFNSSHDAHSVSKTERYKTAIAFHHECIGQHISDALLRGDVDMLKALLDLGKRWAGETREKNPKPLQLAVIQEAFTLWRTLKRNPTRNELWAACEAAGINVGEATNKRGLLDKTGLQFLAKG